MTLHSMLNIERTQRGERGGMASQYAVERGQTAVMALHNILWREDRREEWPFTMYCGERKEGRNDFTKCCGENKNTPLLVSV